MEVLNILCHAQDVADGIFGVHERHAPVAIGLNARKAGEIEGVLVMTGGHRQQHRQTKHKSLKFV